MKLSKNGRDELRKHVVEQLQKVPDGKRIVLDKDLLEDLLFEVTTVDKENGIELKLPVWSGKFLKKIDLSQVDFSNVSWGILGGGGNYFEDDGYRYFELHYPTLLNNGAYRSLINNRTNGGDSDGETYYDVYYEGTNANIDLTKSYEAKHKGYILLTSCNFNGLDFSHQDLTGIGRLCLYDTDISKSKLVIPSDLQFFAYQSNLEGLNLSTREMDAVNSIESHPDDFKENNFFKYCNLRNTGIHINVDSKRMAQQGDCYDSSEKMDMLQYEMKNDWFGCYVNGKLVCPIEEREEVKETKRDAYEQMKAEMFESVTNSIDEQVSHMGK